MNRRLFPVAAAILLAALFAGCGRKGPLVPPPLQAAAAGNFIPGSPPMMAHAPDESLTSNPESVFSQRGTGGFTTIGS
jgi:predicted small lipoprotein YifL